MLTLRAIILLCCLATIAHAYEDCYSDDCAESCDEGECNFCSSSSCCQTSSCNQCVRSCNVGCQQSAGCYQGCVNTCAASAVSCGSSCNSCYTSSCRRRCQSSCRRTDTSREQVTYIERDGQGTSSTGSLSSDTSDNRVLADNKNYVDVLTNITLENKIDNINNISIPIHLNSTNINHITVHQARAYTGSDRVIHINGSRTENIKTKEGKTVYVDRPYPVAQPYPVVKPVPVPYPQYVPVTRTVPVPYPQPVRVPVPQPVAVPYPVTRHVPFPVVRHHPVPFPVPIVQQQHIPIPVVQQQPCQVYGGGGGCATQKFVGGGHMIGHVGQQCQFINQHPWLSCGGAKIEACASCMNCQGSYNPHVCMQSSACPDFCRNIIHKLNFPTIMKK